MAFSLYEQVVKPVGRAWRGIQFIKNHGLKELSFVRGISFSQFGEDLFVDHYFKHVRSPRDTFYVDVGAYHPFRFSNTYLFYRRGWRGVNIEPNPEGYSELLKHRPRDINLNLAISGEDGEKEFICDDAYSGINDEQYLFRERRAEGKSIRIGVRPLRDVLEEHARHDHIDFMSIDCEGHDLEVVRSNDWSQFRPELMLVEDHNPGEDSELNVFMSDLEYRYYGRLHLTKVFVEGLGRSVI